MTPQGPGGAKGGTWGRGRSSFQAEKLGPRPSGEKTHMVRDSEQPSVGVGRAKGQEGSAGPRACCRKWGSGTWELLKCRVSLPSPDPPEPKASW